MLNACKPDYAGICNANYTLGEVLRRWLLFSPLCFFLSACGSNARAPVEDRSAKPKAVPASYSVQRGDTLFSIAWRYGLDYRSVASRNGIAPPYTIFPGQRIYLAQNPPAQTRKSTSSSSAKAATVSAPKKTTAVVKTPPPVAQKNATKTSSNKPVSSWRWPTTGKVTRNYSSTVHKGIDIEGRRGDAINAVAAGRVVYAGSGIVGYGELLIVKHNEVYLSAYGHNSRLLVAEGEQVGAGQQIAEKGSSGTDTVKLHFEIRKEGKPIDPKKLLPTR